MRYEKHLEEKGINRLNAKSADGSVPMTQNTQSDMRFFDLVYLFLYRLKCYISQLGIIKKLLLRPACAPCLVLMFLCVFLLSAASPAGIAVMHEPEAGPRPVKAFETLIVEDEFGNRTYIYHLVAVIPEEEPLVQIAVNTESAETLQAELYETEDFTEPDDTTGFEVAAAETLPNTAGSLGYFMVYAYCNCPECCGSWSPYHRRRMITEEVEYIDEETMETGVMIVSRPNPDYQQRTASGTIPTVRRTIATDWSVLPRGTRVVIDGQLYIAEDTGTGIVGRSIDIYFGDWFDGAHEAALKHGVRRMEVFAAG